jgi:hypothetical protein
LPRVYYLKLLMFIGTNPSTVPAGGEKSEGVLRCWGLYLDMPDLQLDSLFFYKESGGVGGGLSLVRKKYSK